MIIREIKTDSIERSGALELVWRVFSEFEAPEYSEEGVQEFRGFIAPDAVKRRMSNNEMLFWGCYSGDHLTGVIASRPPCHISLLFVDKQHHRKGIARRLLNTVLAYYQTNTPCKEMTVNSSPYAVKAYERLGFIATGTEQTFNGVRFTPMKYFFG